MSHDRFMLLNLVNTAAQVAVNAQAPRMLSQAGMGVKKLV